ncbi:uncharacterized protein LOC111320014 [Stylophora pistillata]|nr:uncharacterized protein LOC111320014 [Stylophora pistillata]
MQCAGLKVPSAIAYHLFKMAEEGRKDKKDEEIKKIAESAIENITKIANIVQGRATTSNALSELQRRFPTTSGRTAASSINTGTNRARAFRSRSTPYSNRNPGRPHGSSTVTKDVIVIEYGKDRIPSKSEKVELEKSGRIICGFELSREWTAVQLEKELSYLLKGSSMDGFSFEIMKNCSGTLVKPNIPLGKRIDSKLLLKSIAPSGGIYIRLLADLPSDDDDDFLSLSSFESPTTRSITSLNSTQSLNPSATSTSAITASASPAANITTSTANASIAEVDLTDEKPEISNASKEQDAVPVHTYQANPVECPFNIDSIIDSAKNQDLLEPVEVLRFLQEHIIQGRKLDIVSVEEPTDGETNFINVNRDTALISTFSELEFIENYRFTFKVGFTGEDVVDLGGPRREWLRIVCREIKEKYFDRGLRRYLAKDYFNVGIMLALTLLQNGPMPAFIEEEILNDVLTSSPQSSNPCIAEVQAGLEKLGMLSALQKLPMLHYLLRPNSQHPITVPKLLGLLKPKYSEQGSNALKHEKELYQLFVRFLREVASGLRSCGNEKLQLSHILTFVTGSAEEPILGFALDPSIEFVKTDLGDGFTPTAHTCSNILSIPVASSVNPLPSQEKLFEIYDLAFSQSYFGSM